jgi:hypothetical protein
MSSIPKGIFIQQSDEGTDVFFLVLSGTSQDTSSTENEWHVEKQNYIPPNEAITLFDKVQSLVPKWTSVDPLEYNPDSVWFVQHEAVEEKSMTKLQALNCAIMALNTLKHPDGTSREAGPVLDSLTDEALAVLSTMREMEED